MGFADVMGGLANGMLGLVGAGSAYNPMAKLSGELQSAITDMNNMVADNTILALQNLQAEVQTQYTAMMLKAKVAQANADATNQQLFDSINVENLFITILSITILLIVFYLIIQKKCC